MRYHKYFFIFLMILLAFDGYGDEKIRSTIQEVLSDSRYEKSLEKKPQKPQTNKSNTSKTSQKQFEPFTERQRHKSTASGSIFDLFPAGLANLLIYSLGIIAVAVIIALVLFNLLNKDYGGNIELQQETVNTTQKDLEKLEELDKFRNSTAQQLFEEGRVADACLKLFHESVKFLIQNKYLKFKVHYTPRDILYKAKDIGEIKQNLKNIVNTIEKGQYAKLTLDVEDYQVCQNSLQALTTLQKQK